MKYTFDRLMSKEAAPQYRVVYGEVKRAGHGRTIRFDFARPSAELPLLVGNLPVFSREWGAGKKFDQVVMDQPIATGPYKIRSLNFGRDITYERDPTTGRKISACAAACTTSTASPTRSTATPLRRRRPSRRANSTICGPSQPANGRVSTSARSSTPESSSRPSCPSKNAGDFQGFLINTRRDKFKDPRVREALALAFDYEWLNRRLMYSAYTRCRGWFNGSDFEAKGFPARTSSRSSSRCARSSIRRCSPSRCRCRRVPIRRRACARTCARRASSWRRRDGPIATGRCATRRARRSSSNIDGGSGGERVVTPWFQALGKLGIEGVYRRADFALIQKRLDVFDFDLFTVRWPGSESSGSELVDRFGSGSADTEGSSNLIGIKDSAVDALLDKVVSAHTRPELIGALRSLDRVCATATSPCRNGSRAPIESPIARGNSSSRRLCRCTTSPRTGSSPPGGGNARCGRTSSSGCSS